MRIFMIVFWVSMVVFFGSWNILNSKDIHPFEIAKDLYTEHFQDKRVVLKEEKVYDKNFEHLHKWTH